MINVLHRLVGKITQDECDVMVEYVMKLYNPTRECRRWPMVKRYVEQTKILLGSILESDTCFTDISSVVEAVREHSPERQLCELNQAYHTLQNSGLHSNCYTKDLFYTKKGLKIWYN